MTATKLEFDPARVGPKKFIEKGVIEKLNGIIKDIDEASNNVEGNDLLPFWKERRREGEVVIQYFTKYLPTNENT